MPEKDQLYQTILSKLEAIPPSYLEEIDRLLQKITLEIQQKAQQKLAILDLAGAWSDMSEADFKAYQEFIRETKTDMFTRDVEL